MDLLTDIDLLLIVEKGIRGGIYHCIYQYAKANNKYMKYYEENKELSYLKYWDANNLYAWAMLQKLPVNNNLSGSKIVLINEALAKKRTASKEALKHELVLKKLHRIIKFKEKAWLKSHIDKNRDLRKKSKI